MVAIQQNSRFELDMETTNRKYHDPKNCAARPKSAFRQNSKSSETQNLMYRILNEFARQLAFCVTILYAINSAHGQGEVKFSDQQLEFFETKVRPLLVDKCYQCHGNDSESLEGGLSLASRKSMLAGGDSGPAIAPGKPNESLIIDAINYGEIYQMPPDSKLASEEIEILTRWVKMGSPWPADSDIEVKSTDSFDLEERKSNHWCWQPIVPPDLPSVTNSDWPLDPIDHFVLSKLEASNVQPSETAEKRVLIRRLYFDIIGLPPTPSQVESFLKDESKDAYSKVVDRLLASERFGERWARHWMDLVRYAETTGHEFDYAIPHAYRYRDYLIRAFNRDVPYDQFVREHIAGDLLESPRMHPTEQFNESVIGTGFWFFHEGHHAPVDVKADEAKRIDNQIDVMTKTFLALTVSCARCHDHKFDAISTKDFYSLYGFLKSSRRQDAMLDPGGRIEQAHEQSREASNELGKQILKLKKLTENPDQQKIANHLYASIMKLRSDPSWCQKEGITIEGEKLSRISHESGDLEVQKLGAQGGFSWQGDKQIWWRDGNVGERAFLEFKVPEQEEQEYEVFICLTRARDYGKTKITLNEKVLHEGFDCYNSELTTTGRMSFGKYKLKPGKQKLVLEIVGHHPDAIQRHMVGIDYIELVPQVNLVRPSVPSDLAKYEKSTNADLVNRIVNAIKSERLADQDHPLHLLQTISNGYKSLDDDSVSNRKSGDQNKKSSRRKEQTELFVDFKNNVLPDGWSQTGKAFDVPPSAFASTTGDLIADPDALQSGMHHGAFQGVIRSPSFVLNHDKIFYRVKGSKARIRLIIEGYQLDTFNALLFKGATIDIPTTERYRWVEQAGDLKNHKGRLAHIEIIDQADGHISIDQIRFSNGPMPSSRLSNVTRQYNEELGERETNAKDFSEFAARTICALIAKTDSEATALQSWILEHELSDLLVKNGIRISANKDDSNTGKVRLLNNEILNTRESCRKRDDIPIPVLAVAMIDGTSANEHVFVRGNHKTLGEIVPRNFLEALQPQPLNLKTRSGRMELANSIVNQDNPLTARVIVNRVWHHLLGRGIVRSVDNFGVLGQLPTHPQLLDHLATRFVKNGWSIKTLIREIVHSKTYQLSSVAVPDSKTTDPKNDLFHSANVHRLEGEAIRDSIIQVASGLDESMYGPSVSVHLTKFLSGRGKPSKSGPLDGDRRRSVYLEVRRNFLSPMMLAFDTPIPFNTIGRRNRSNVPAQALILMNDPFVFEQAKRWAESLISQDQSVEQRIDSIYMSAFARKPTTDQKDKTIEFLNEQASLIGVAPNKIKNSIELWRDLCHVIFNAKPFIYIE